MHERDSHVHGLLIALHELLLLPRAWYFRMDGICAGIYLCDFDRFDPLVLVLYGISVAY